ncbi:MAG: FAD-dependent oxidoreductase [Armatimonadota bacterium]
MRKRTTLVEPRREIPVIGAYDVVVAGGGPGGICAAVAAARAGARTLLVERYGFLGGIATAGWVDLLLGIAPARTGEMVVGGIFREIVDEMAALDCARPFDEGIEKRRIPFEPEAFKLVADALVLGSGADLLLHSPVSDAIVEGDRLQAIVLEGKSGPRAVEASVFVDATGDADLVARSGARWEMGRPADGRVQAMSLILQMGGLDMDRVPTRDGADPAEAQELMREALLSGLPAYRWHTPERSPDERQDSLSFNVTHLGGNPIDVRNLTRAEVKGRRDAWEIARWMTETIPGMEEAYLQLTAHMVAVRESRRMVGIDTITVDDVQAGRKREDAVARCTFGLDVHCPMAHTGPEAAQVGGTACRATCGKRDCIMLTKYRDQVPKHGGIKDRSWYDIPWGALVSADLHNLVTCGRCVSADHQTMASLRVMGPAMATGQAAGEGAAMAAASGDARSIDVSELQRRLRDAGAAV